jgi:hypothetical protein
MLKSLTQLAAKPSFSKKNRLFSAKFEVVFEGCGQIIKISRVWAGSGACSAQGVLL